MEIEARGRDWRLILGFLMAPAIWAALFISSLGPVLRWFRPAGSNMAIGMFCFLVSAVVAIAVYPLGIGFGYLYMRRLRDLDHPNRGLLLTGALSLGAGLGLLVAVIPLLAHEFALAVALMVTMMLASMCAGVCFHLIGGIGSYRVTKRIGAAEG